MIPHLKEALRAVFSSVVVAAVVFCAAGSSTLSAQKSRERIFNIPESHSNTIGDIIWME